MIYSLYSIQTKKKINKQQIYTITNIMILGFIIDEEINTNIFK